MEDHVFFVHKSRVFVFGGLPPESSLGPVVVISPPRLFSYSFVLQYWEPLMVNMICSSRAQHAGCLVDDKFYFYGGRRGNETLSDFYVIDFEACVGNNYNYVTTVHQIDNPTLPARKGHSMNSFGSKIFLFGGTDSMNWSTNTLFQYDIASSTWSEVVVSAGQTPLARSRHSSVVHGSVLFIFGGMGHQDHFFNDVHCFDFHTQSWSQPVTSLLPGSPGPIQTTLCGSRVFMLASQRVHVFSTNDFSIESVDLDSQITFAKHGLALAWCTYNGTVYVFNDENEMWPIKHPFTPRIPIIPSTLTTDFSYFVNNPELSDVRLLVGDVILFAHKMVLCQSEHFRSLIMSQEDENSDSDVLDIDITGTTPQCMILFLQYLYTKSYEIPLNSLWELLSLSKRYKEQSLYSICERQLAQSLTIENACEILQEADFYESINLRCAVLSFIETHYEAVVAYGQVSSLNEDLQREVTKLAGFPLTDDSS
eukprot:GILK01013346.1.p1 GENE.GILK01013346.1~~GILK01013346.1.p1  ORF type:complete len:491 (-),score=29.93 GILK01013346.1:252-1691(-)